MRIFERFGRDNPNSPALARLYAGVVEMLNQYNQPASALGYAQEFMDRFGDSDEFYAVAEEAVASHRRLGREDRVQALFANLVRRADRRGERGQYLKYLSSLIQSHVKERQYSEAVGRYWTEIEAHPKDEELFKRFLQFLSRYKLYNEQLAVYRRAIESFGDPGYYDKLARWYLRNKRQSEFQELTRKVADIFSDSELADFFKDFLRSGDRASDPDSVFYKTMHEYANERFPRNLHFVRGLLRFYRRHEMWGDFDALGKRYFYVEDVRKDWIEQLSARGLLEGVTAGLAGGGSLPGTLGGEAAVGALPESPAEVLLLAEIARFGSYYEAAAPLFETLLRAHRGNADFLSALASLHRSFGRAEEAEQLYARLSRLRPLDKKHPTAAGEVAIEDGRPADAARHWRRIIPTDPADSDTYLEVASIFWDYYRFGDAADTLLLGRERLGDPALFGAKLAAVYESAKDYSRAVAEYVRTAALEWESSWRVSEVVERLVRLAKSRDMAGDIRQAFRRAVEANAEDFRYVKAFARYLAERKDSEARRALLADAVDRYAGRDDLRWLASTFRREGWADAEEKAIRKTLRAFGETPENILLLAEFCEREGRLDDASRAHRRRVGMLETDEPELLGKYIRALDDAAGFAWRHDRFDDAFRWWRAAALAASGYERDNRLHQLAQRLLERGRLEDAAAALRRLLERHPTSTEYFNTLARVHSERDDYRGLAQLYSEAIEAVRADAALSSDDRRERIIRLRRGMIDNLVKLGDFTAAVDQYIEIINARYDADAMIAEAYRFAAEHDLARRLIDYYVKTSEKSFKDFRWNYVLARLAEQQNDLARAVSQWRKAVRNEPQRLGLRLALADDLLKLQHYAEAVEVYREVYRLDRRNTDWLLTIARTQARAGDTESATATLDTILEGEPPAYGKYFQVAAVLESWGELDAAARRLETGLQKLKADIYKERLSTGDLELYVRVGVKRDRTMETFQSLLDLNSLYTREAGRPDNAERWIAREGQRVTYAAFSGSFAEALGEYGDDASKRAIAQRLTGYLDDFPDNKSTADFVIGAARAMGFAEVAERALAAKLRLLNNYNDRYAYRDQLRQTLRYFQDRGQTRAAVETLERELGRSTMWSFRDEMLRLHVSLVRYTGDQDAEIAALRDYWKETGGSELRLNKRDEHVRRLLDLLLARGRDSALREITSTANGHSGQVVNHLLARGRPTLAAAAIEAAALKRDKKWRDSKKLLVRAYAGDAETDLGPHGSAEALMGIEQIGSLLSSPPDPGKAFVGDEWFEFTPHLAQYFYSVTGDQRFRRYIIGLAEGRPSSAGAQSKIASWYADRKLYDFAQEHYDMALQLGGDRAEVLASLGALHLKRGDERAAMETWKEIVAGDAGVKAWTDYFNALSENGFLRQATVDVLGYLERTLLLPYDWDRRYLLERVASRQEDSSGMDLVVDAIVRIAARMESPIDMLDFALYSLEFAPGQKARVYQAAIRAAAEQEPYREGGDQVNTVHRYWLEQAIGCAVDNELFQRAASWIDEYEAAGFADEQSWEFRDGGRYWQLKARALFAIGRGEAADAALRKLWDTDPPSLSASRAAYEILVAAGRLRQAEQLLVDYYDWALAEGRDSDNIYTGLASIHLDRAERDAAGREGHRDAAIAVLDRLVNRDANDAGAMRAAAELLEGRSLYREAARYRGMLRRLDPLDWSSAIQLAGDLARAGDGEEAAALAGEMISADRLPASARSRLPELITLLYGEDAAGAAELLEAAAGRRDRSQAERLVYAELALLAGRRDEFRSALDGGIDSFIRPDRLLARRARAALDEGRAGDAAADLAAALRLAADAGTRRALLEAHLGSGRHLRALSLAAQYDEHRFYWSSSNRLATLFDAQGEAQLEVAGKLIDCALAAGLPDAADFLESRREDIARALEVEVQSRREEIDRLREESEPPKPPVEIRDSLTN